ncbi:D-lactaldehyde dehydrogenase [Lentinula aciculospora]|uniref:D-lactaldehyde dehydrogenase n=1 Tax=Lentinula aciculospora TaxID=153920 RepID=A0A9W9DIA6_9AGAR|nr:D-lactaldehyde dehydrogenase [Lentinula aciculospora]
MPIVSAGSKVLVTGANGFVAAWVIHTLLEKGYKVRGTIRSEGKGVHLKKIFADYGNNFELVVVEDITKDGAFDEAIKGVDAIAHTASPFQLAADDPEELITPAVNGTVSILKSALTASTLKRIILLSSCAAILSLLPDPKPFTESDWNDQAIEDVKANGKNANQVNKYCASKTLAEKAAWELYNTNKANVSWDLVALNPPYIFGPIIHEVTSPAALNTSTSDWYNSVVRSDMGGKSLDEIAVVGNGWVDIRDVALAHVLAFQKEKAGGERLIILEGDFSYQDFTYISDQPTKTKFFYDSVDAANALSPSPIPSHMDFPKGNPGAGKKGKPIFPYDASKAPRILGPELVYHTKEETTRDMLADFERRGW